MCAHAWWEGYRPVVSGGQSCHSILDGRNQNAAPEGERADQIHHFQIMLVFTTH